MAGSHTEFIRRLWETNFIRRIRTRREIDTGYLYLSPLMAVLIAFFLLPVLTVAWVSFHEYSFQTIIGETLTVSNYYLFFTEPFYQRFTWYTLKLAMFNTAACVLLGYPVAYYLVHTSKVKRGLILFLVILPLMVGSVVRAYGWIVLLGDDGMLDRLTELFLTEGVVLLGTTPAVYIGMFHIMLPFAIIPIYSSLESIDESLIWGARDLGANKLDAFVKITLPLSLPGVVSGSIFVFTITMSAIVTPQLLGGRSDYTMGAMIYDMVFTNSNWPFAATMGVVISTITFSLIFIYLFTFRKDITEL